MIKCSDILSIPFLKKSVFTGSCQGMRYRLEKITTEEAESLKAAIWDAPYSFAATGEEKKEYREFPFSEEGIQQAVDWLNESWEAGKERWRKAQSSW